MKHTIFLYLLFSFLFFGCKKEENKKSDYDDLSQLCSYQKRGNTILSDDCESDFFVNRLSSNGTVSYDSALNSYVISRHIKGTIDCIIVTLFCEEDFSNLIDKEINYSADYYEYTGTYNAPLGGISVFVAKNIEYSLKK